MSVCVCVCVCVCVYPPLPTQIQTVLTNYCNERELLVFTVMKIHVEICALTPCSIILGHQRFGGRLVAHLQG
jgi:hypothetical protein